MNLDTHKLEGKLTKVNEASENVSMNDDKPRYISRHKPGIFQSTLNLRPNQPTLKK